MSGIKVADGQGSIDRSVSKIWVADSQGAIDKQIQYGYVAPSQGSINRVFYKNILAGSIMYASASGTRDKEETLYTANVTTSPSIRPLKIYIYISAYGHSNGIPAYCRVEYKKDGNWTFIEDKTFGIYNYTKTESYTFELPGNLSIDNIRYRVTNLASAVGEKLVIYNFYGKVIQWYEN